MRLSTPRIRGLRLYPSCLVISLVTLILALSVPAMAMECDDDTPGLCLDAGTFEWCEGGEVKSAKCPEGQICVADNPFYDGAGCVSTDDTACGDISAEGECTTANGVVWCDEGVPMVYPCGDESTCGWDEESGEYDCLPQTSIASAENTNETEVEEPEPPSGEGPSPEEGARPEVDTTPTPDPSLDEPDEASDEEDFGTDEELGTDDGAPHMSPVVTPTDESGVDSQSGEALDTMNDSGCQGAPAAPPWWLFTSLSIMAILPRRQRGRITNA